MTDRVSIIIPARNERYLQQTIDDLLAKAAGDVEIIPVLDGLLSDGTFQPVREDPRVKPLRKPKAEGMRPAINDAVQLATGTYLLKADAHCIFAPGYDAVLKADCDADWLVVPTRHSIDIASWTVSRRDYNYSVLTYPYLPSMYGSGLHAVTFDQGINKAVNAQRADRPIDDLLSFQGSCWFQHRSNFLRLGPLVSTHYGPFYQECQEIGGRQWATGGRCVINKRTSYGHMHKGKAHQGADGRIGRGFLLSLHEKRRAEAYATDFWIHDRWPGTTLPFVALIERFWWLIAQMQDPRYAWPADWRDFEGHRLAFETRPADQIPVHT